MTVAVLFISLFVFLIIGVPIAIALGASALVTIYFTTTLPLTIMTQKAFTALDSFPLLAIPFFMLAGVLMGKAGVSRRLLTLATMLVGWMVGGLAMVTVVTCMFFAAISGSGPATVAAIGSFMIPSMKAKQYDEGFAAALTAASGSIGVIIPPSIPFVMYGVIGGVSIGSMFLAGIIPGMIIGLGLMVVSFLIAKKKDYKPDTSIDYSFKAVLKAIYDAKWALLIPVIILGGIYGGIFSPTEAAVVAVVYATLIGIFVHKELSMKDIYECIRESIVINATTMIIVGLSISFAYIMTLEQIPNNIAGFITDLSSNPLVILLVINLILLVVGMFIDTISALVVLTPILLPIVTAVGIDPIHFGVILVANLAIGFITPPLGVNLFVASSIGNVKIERIVSAILPFLLSMLITLFLITYIPVLSTWLPGLLK
ncbi:TRAP transporter large permease [Cytobacillus horneckiae]|uniref:TRAP transporter large permease n=1 Tax=Cytobacillus horneckiae TaxID=549687 RepID=A0A2N0Z8N2_9BACI|nr:TRAP transporter large permease [Cytobacillus horneckiae]MEC1157684.1 TRAP transporter large permease [Cytobacillus horneckiae]MED2940743.1 TRAP transporter large permease [Cytobacillus horneckiae]PKG25862.1 TRAP transporter large permease [Cytobacillus horneckiae]